MTIHSQLVALLLFATTALSPEVLRARHAGTKSLSAEIVQTKEGRYWARPLVSHIRLTWTPQRMEWLTRDPVPSRVVIEGGHIVVSGGAGSRDLRAAEADPRFAALLRLLQALAAFDLEALQQDHALAWGGRDVVATPTTKSGAALLTRIRLVFDDDAEIRLIELTMPSEVTRLEFQRVERTR